MRYFLLLLGWMVAAHAQTTSDPAALLQQAQSAYASKRYDLVVPLIEKLLASNPPSNVVASAQELRAKTYQDWLQWLQQSEASVAEMMASNTTAIAAAKEELAKAREAFAAETAKAGSGFKSGSAGGKGGRGSGSSGGVTQMGKMSSALSDEMKAVAAAEKKLSDLEAKQYNLNSQLTNLRRYSAQIQARMTELNIQPKGEQPPPTAPAPAAAPK